MHWGQAQEHRVARLLWAVGTERYRKRVQVWYQSPLSIEEAGVIQTSASWLTVEVSLVLFEVSWKCGQLDVFQMAC